LRPGEVVPPEVLAFVAGQLDVDPDTLAAYAVRSRRLPNCGRACPCGFSEEDIQVIVCI